MLEIRNPHAAVATSEPFLGVLYQHQPRGLDDFNMRLIIPDACEFQFIIQCINICQKKHINTCGQRGLEPVDLKVIDCDTRTVVNAPLDCRWVALSYVWGPPPYDETLQSPPQVIEDSIEVCELLGYRYLWVDRYCIDQSATEKKMVQILQMDRIYKNAELTIVAAAGDGPKHGLPGISTARKLQPSLRLDDCMLLSILPGLPVSMQGSKWVTRGWTFQEWILSRRRLIFTDDQVFFECTSMHCPESLVNPTFTAESGNEAHGLPMHSFRVGLGLHRRGGDDFSHNVSMFCLRELTYASDTLNAMEGTFQTLSRTQFPVYTFMGIPIRTRTTTGVVFTRPCQSFVDGLGWYAKSPGKRLTEFPSWTWAGTKGTIETKTVIPNENSRANVQVWIEGSKGRMIAFPEEFRGLSTFLDKLRAEQCLHLQIEATVLTVDLEDLTEQKIAGYLLDGYYAIFSKPSERYVVGSAYLDRPLPDTELRNLRAVIIQGDELNTTSASELEVKMILVHERNHIYERVGVVVQMSLLEENAWGAEPRRILQEWWEGVRKTAPKKVIRLG
jgi:hypothetical protein